MRIFAYIVFAYSALCAIIAAPITGIMLGRNDYHHAAIIGGALLLAVTVGFAAACYLADTARDASAKRITKRVRRMLALNRRIHPSACIVLLIACVALPAHARGTGGHAAGNGGHTASGHAATGHVAGSAPHSSISHAPATGKR